MHLSDTLCQSAAILCLASPSFFPFSLFFFPFHACNTTVDIPLLAYCASRSKNSSLIFFSSQQSRTPSSLHRRNVVNLKKRGEEGGIERNKDKERVDDAIKRERERTRVLARKGLSLIFDLGWKRLNRGDPSRGEIEQQGRGRDGEDGSVGGMMRGSHLC